MKKQRFAVFFTMLVLLMLVSSCAAATIEGEGEVQEGSAMDQLVSTLPEGETVSQTYEGGVKIIEVEDLQEVYYCINPRGSTQFYGGLPSKDREPFVSIVASIDLCQRMSTELKLLYLSGDKLGYYITVIYPRGLEPDGSEIGATCTYKHDYNFFSLDINGYWDLVDCHEE